MKTLKTVFKYWWFAVFLPAVRFALPLAKLKDRATELVVTVTVATLYVIITGSLDPTLDIGFNPATFVYVLLATFGLRLLAGLILIPAQGYEELGGFDKDQLKLTVVPDCESHSDSGADSWLGLTLLNRSVVEIQECSVELSQINKEGMPPHQFSRPQRLLWSSEEPTRHGRLSIFAGGDRRVDLVVTHRELNTVGFTLQNPPQAPLPYSGNPKGRYQLVMVIRGIFQRRRFCHEYSLEFEYMGGALLVSDMNRHELEPLPCAR